MKNTESNMFYKASRYSFERAKELRKSPTYTEAMLWNYLRTKPLGYKFRRQHPINKYVVDFFCYQLKLVIEADGEVHEKYEIKKADEERQKNLEFLDLRILRFTDKEILNDYKTVVASINSCINNRINELKGSRLLLPL